MRIIAAPWCLRIQAGVKNGIAGLGARNVLAFRDAMPLNATGKIDKKALRAELSYTSRC